MRSFLTRNKALLVSAFVAGASIAPALATNDYDTSVTSATTALQTAVTSGGTLMFAVAIPVAGWMMVKRFLSRSH